MEDEDAKRAPGFWAAEEVVELVLEAVEEAAAVFVVSTSELSCFKVWVRFLEASASARVSSLGL